ncbi:MAG TPA: phosphatase PAP2 family protein, partial [Cytophagales bacterium]|nr:phosphatase PAP2 family protein [Cytophagales bacterium]
MLERLLSWDREVFLWFNGQHSPFWDPVWVTITEKQTWYVLYALLIAFLLWKYRWQGLLAVVLLILSVVLADQLTSGLMKPLFARPRPCHEPSLEGLIHLIKYCGGPYGFASSHAANSFAVAIFAGHMLRSFGRWIPPLWWLWAAVISYSRVAVGVHYPG